LNVLMVANVIVWDIETVPDIKSFAAANGHDGKSDDEIRVAMGDKFPKHIYHSIICIGALIAQRPFENPLNGRFGRDSSL
jgi:predicted PolB exonuclease-like 3'-5' exonuclease